jgi:hypothetical protein
LLVYLCLFKHDYLGGRDCSVPEYSYTTAHMFRESGDLTDIPMSRRATLSLPFTQAPEFVHEYACLVILCFEKAFLPKVDITDLLAGSPPPNITLTFSAVESDPELDPPFIGSGSHTPFFSFASNRGQSSTLLLTFLAGFGPGGHQL